MSAQEEETRHRVIHYHPDSELTVELSWHTVTDIGYRREINEDSFVASPPIFAVADGMGGHSAGEIASGAVAQRLAELAGDRALTPDHIEGALKAAVHDIEINPGTAISDAGTTVTGVAFGAPGARPTWRVFNIGDSRVYQLFKGALSQITVDHSVVQHLIDTGAINPEEAEVHPHANVITRAVGVGEEPIPDYSELALIPGQRLLICSDGLTKELTDLGIKHFLESADTAEEAANSLVEQSLKNSGRDNVTVIVIDVHAVGDARDTSNLGDLLKQSES